MKRHIFTIPALATALLLAGVSSLTAGLTGAIFTTNSNGSVVNGNQYDSPCSVYLDGGPGPHAPATAAGLPDGDYYFQVTDPSGRTLLSTDPVANRHFRVTGGVIVAYISDGIVTDPIHLTGIDQDHPELGAITIRLANLNCASQTQTPDFAPSPNNGGAYKVWATPVLNFLGNPALVDPSCGTGCFHGFVPSASKTDNFKVNAAAATFCMTVLKVDGSSNPVTMWPFTLTDPLGTFNTYFTDGSGQLQVCGLVSGTYVVAEDPGSSLISITTNVTPIPLVPPIPTSISFSWTGGQLPPMIMFKNQLPPPSGGVPE
jgi:hypothetical protein